MSDLTDALDRFPKVTFDEADMIIKTLRMVANPDIEAATRYAVRLFIGDKAADKPIMPHIQTGVERIVTIALTPPADD